MSKTKSLPKKLILGRPLCLWRCDVLEHVTSLVVLPPQLLAIRGRSDEQDVEVFAAPSRTSHVPRRKDNILHVSSLGREDHDSTGSPDGDPEVAFGTDA